MVLANMYFMEPTADPSNYDLMGDLDLSVLDMLPQNDKEWLQLFRAQVAQHHQVRQVSFIVGVSQKSKIKNSVIEKAIIKVSLLQTPL